MLQRGMNEAVSFAWAAVSLATARELLQRRTDEKRRRERRRRGGGGGGLDEGVKCPAESGDRKENMEPEMLVEIGRLEGAADVEGGL